MFTKLEAVERRYVELEGLLVSPEVINNRREFAKLAKERSGLEEIVATFRTWKDVQAQIEGSKSLLQDADEEVRALAQEELPELKRRNETLEARLKQLLLPRDPNDERSPSRSRHDEPPSGTGNPVARILQGSEKGQRRADKGQTLLRPFSDPSPTPPITRRRSRRP